MEIVEQIKSLNNRQKDLNTEKLKIKAEFEIFIKDKSISICQRWNVFSMADENMKNNLDFLPRSRGEMLNKEIKQMVNIPECYGRGKRIDTKDFFHESYSEEEQMFYPAGYEKTELEPAKDYESKDIVGLKMFKLMEEILQDNLGSFCFDW